MDAESAPDGSGDVSRARPSAALAALPRGLIFHSDRGTEYIGATLCAFVACHGVQQSATVLGPGDNARAESFFHLLKAELTRSAAFPTETGLRGALASYIRCDNEHRLHSAPGCRLPLAFERQAA